MKAASHAVIEAVHRCVRQSPFVRSQSGEIALGGRGAPCDQACWGEVKIAVADYAVRLRELGVPPERALLEIKHTLREAAPTLDASSTLASCAVPWFLKGYYDGAPMLDL